MRAVDLHSKRLVKTYGLTGPQVLLLKELTRGGEVPVGQLAKSISLSHGTVTDIIARLERKGLVQRTRDSVDKRRVLAKTTGLAAEIMKTAPSLLQERFVDRFSQLQDWEQTLILSSLQRIATMMEAKEIEAAPILASGALTAPAGQSAEATVVPGQPSEGVHEPKA
jgi:DNA-binding MarR family transcriptional regulator